MINNFYSINICKEAANMSTNFENNNSDLKKEYYMHCINLFHNIVSSLDGYQGSFGTGYPFYAVNNDFSGQLPIIEEQIRYNNELITAAEKSKRPMWTCSTCLQQSAYNMPDLKQVCKPCTNMDDDLKPRKVINRLPDIDMWAVCENETVEKISQQLIPLFKKHGLSPSDINPVETIFDFIKINESLEKGIMPEKSLPLDAHIIDYQTFFQLIERVPYVMKQASLNNDVPYIPIHPLSYRKKWQHDDTAYNFIHDFLASLTEENFGNDLKEILEETRKIIATSYSFDQLYYYLVATGQPSFARRHNSPVLKKVYETRINSWKK